MSSAHPVPGPKEKSGPQTAGSNAKPIARRGSLTRPSPIPSRIVRSAGALVWRPADKTQTPKVGKKYQADEIEVLLVHRPRYDDWSWPKGKAELNEPLLAAGVREVEEETGILVSLYAPLTAQRYRLGMGQTKEVYYWVGIAVSETGVAISRPPVTPAPKKEIDEARWVKPEQAREMLTRRGDRRLLDDLVARAENGSLFTATLAFVSHAQCIGKDRVEAQRSLSRVGTRQAIELIDMLSALGVTRLLTSPAQRCRSTLEPYATVSGVSLSVAEELQLPPECGYVPAPKPVPAVKKNVPSPAMFAARIGGQLKVPAVSAQNTEPEAPVVKTQIPFHAVKLDSAREVVEKLIAHPGAPLAVSAHPELVEHMLQPLVKAASISVARQFPEGEAYNHTAQLTVVHVAYPHGNASTPEVVAVEVHRATERG